MIETPPPLARLLGHLDTRLQNPLWAATAFRPPPLQPGAPSTRLLRLWISPCASVLGAHARLGPAAPAPLRASSSPAPPSSPPPRLSALPAPPLRGVAAGHVGGHRLASLTPVWILDPSCVGPGVATSLQPPRLSAAGLYALLQCRSRRACRA